MSYVGDSEEMPRVEVDDQSTATTKEISGFAQTIRSTACLTKFIIVAVVAIIVTSLLIMIAVADIEHVDDDVHAIGLDVIEIKNFLNSGGHAIGLDVIEIKNFLNSGGCSQPGSLISASFPGMQGIRWSQIAQTAQTSPLNFYLYSPNASTPRRWIDNYLRPELLERFGIQLNRLDAVYTGCNQSAMKVVCDISNEIAAGKTTTGGSVDLIWINGVNFANAKRLNLLYGPWATLIPNAGNFDFSDPSINLDVGIPTEGLEMPFNSAQSIFIHDKVNVPNPPMTIPALLAWINANPGRFVYSDPSVDFTGATFIRHVFFAVAAPYTDFMSIEINEALYLERSRALWNALRSIQHDLYTPTPGTPWYPASHNNDIRPLVANGTLWLDFSMQVSEVAQQKINPVNTWPTTMDSYLLSTGTIADVNFLAIPVNAAHKEAALVAANFIGSAGAMFHRATPEGWGAIMPFDEQSPSIKEWDIAFDYIDFTEDIPTVEELGRARLGDLPAALRTRLNQDWVTNVRDYRP